MAIQWYIVERKIRGDETFKEGLKASFRTNINLNTNLTEKLGGQVLMGVDSENRHLILKPVPQYTVGSRKVGNKKGYGMLHGTKSQASFFANAGVSKGAVLEFSYNENEQFYYAKY